MLIISPEDSYIEYSNTNKCNKQLKSSILNFYTNLDKIILSQAFFKFPKLFHFNLHAG